MPCTFAALWITSSTHPLPVFSTKATVHNCGSPALRPCISPALHTSAHVQLVSLRSCGCHSLQTNAFTLLPAAIKCWHEHYTSIPCAPFSSLSLFTSSCIHRWVKDPAMVSACHLLQRERTIRRQQYEQSEAVARQQAHYQQLQLQQYQQYQQQMLLQAQKYQQYQQYQQLLLAQGVQGQAQ